ncbi:MAG TPA: acyl-CoA dehydrogenase family protein [Smithella sp.]|nr:acyl-CoA dehydrogenase family protein [Smithella sp.]HPL67444.1 acyl-CoA dehydrogenase family protein [Smithellaceae bacterium]
MDFEFNEDRKMMIATLEKFIQKECSPEFARAIDESEEFPHELYHKMADLGFMALPFSDKYGGMNGNIIDEVLIIEYLSKASAAIGLTYFLSTCFGGKSIEYFGTDEQKQFFLPKLFSGEMLFALALTEPGGGTDILGSMKTTAVKDGDRYVINGQKTFITGAHVADYLVTVVKTGKDTEKKSGGLSTFLVDAKSPGISMRRLHKLGIRATGTNEIFFTDVVVPADSLMGVEHRGWSQVVNTLNNERVGLAALSVGVGQAALEIALEYAKVRVAFSRPIGAFQSIQNYLAEMATDIEMARLLTYKAAWLQSKGIRSAKESAMAKLAASEIGFQAAVKGMRIMAGYGYMMEYDMQRFFRDAELFLHAPITNEMAKSFIAMEMGLPRGY